ncbi:MAG: hypothetical protein WC512_01015 [Candidatus Omnitrophota bacterium]
MDSVRNDRDGLDGDAVSKYIWMIFLALILSILGIGWNSVFFVSAVIISAALTSFGAFGIAGQPGVPDGGRYIRMFVYITAIASIARLLVAFNFMSLYERYSPKTVYFTIYLIGFVIFCLNMLSFCRKMKLEISSLAWRTYMSHLAYVASAILLGFLTMIYARHGGKFEFNINSYKNDYTDLAVIIAVTLIYSFLYILLNLPHIASIMRKEINAKYRGTAA